MCVVMPNLDYSEIEAELKIGIAGDVNFVWLTLMQRYPLANEICEKREAWRKLLKRQRKNPHAVALGRLGGLVRSEAKRHANRENGRKGGQVRSHNDRSENAADRVQLTRIRSLGNSVAVL